MKKSAIIFTLLIMKSITAYGGSLQDIGVEYPFFVSKMPLHLKNADPKKSTVYSSNDFKMKNIKTIHAAKLISLRGLPDMRCATTKMKKCILLYGINNGAISFILNKGLKSFSHGVIYKGGKATGEVIK